MRWEGNHNGEKVRIWKDAFVERITYSPVIHLERLNNESSHPGHTATRRPSIGVLPCYK
jgi:hypothetical protein